MSNLLLSYSISFLLHNCIFWQEQGGSIQLCVLCVYSLDVWKHYALSKAYKFNTDSIVYDMLPMNKNHNFVVRSLWILLCSHFLGHCINGTVSFNNCITGQASSLRILSKASTFKVRSWCPAFVIPDFYTTGPAGSPATAI